MQNHFDAVILAGYDRSKPDPLFAQSGEAHKALLKIAGKPMISYVVDALAQSQLINRIVIVGIDPASEDPARQLKFAHPVHYLPDQGGIIDNVIFAFEWLTQSQSPECYCLLLTGDIPLITGPMIDWFIQACQPYEKDVYWGIVEKRTMEAAFPQSKRTYLRVVEGQFCSGDLFLGQIAVPLRRQALFREMVANRKSIVRQLRLLGFGVILKFLLRRLALQDLLRVANRALAVTGAPVIVPFAEVGMDVDKPHQLAQVLAYLEQQARLSTANADKAETAHG